MVRDHGWEQFSVVTTETMDREALDWCLLDEQAGWFSSRLFGGMRGTVGQPKHWMFTDPDVAFYFKITFANGVPNEL
jgi:hypothetical protein